MEYQILVRYHFSAGTLIVIKFGRREEADAAYRQLQKEGGKYLSAVKLYEPVEGEEEIDVI